MPVVSVSKVVSFTSFKIQTQKKDTKAGKSVKKDPKADLNKNKKGEQPSGKQPDEKKKPATGKKEEDKDDCEQLNEAIKGNEHSGIESVERFCLLPYYRTHWLVLITLTRLCVDYGCLIAT